MEIELRTTALFPLAILFLKMDQKNPTIVQLEKLAHFGMEAFHLDVKTNANQCQFLAKTLMSGHVAEPWREIMDVITYS